MVGRILLLAALLSVQPILAQTADATLHTVADLAQREAKLVEKAKTAASGYAMEPVDEFGTARTLLVVRMHTGEAERHQFWADQFVVTKGMLTLIVGGTMQGEHPNGTSPGETLAPSIEGGKEIVMHAGDIVHIPAGLPHWVKIAPGTSATYLAFKEK